MVMRICSNTLINKKSNRKIFEKKDEKKNISFDDSKNISQQKYVQSKVSEFFDESFFSYMKELSSRY